MQIHNKDLTFLCIYLLFGVADLGSFGLDSDLGVWILIRILLGPDPTWIRIQICNTAVTGNKESVLTHCLPLHALHIFSALSFSKKFYITLSSTNLTLQPMVMARRKEKKRKNTLFHRNYMPTIFNSFYFFLFYFRSIPSNLLLEQ